jgi:hypothetical protein
MGDSVVIVFWNEFDDWYENCCDKIEVYTIHNGLHNKNSARRNGESSRRVAKTKSSPKRTKRDTAVLHEYWIKFVSFFNNDGRGFFNTYTWSLKAEMASSLRRYIVGTVKVSRHDVWW